MELRLGTRTSALALAQTQIVAELLHQNNISTQVVAMTTTGDQILDTPLSAIPSRSLFTKQLEVALLESSVDIVVHSLKDVASDMPPGLVLACILPRADPHDVLVLPPGSTVKSIANLPPGAKIGSGSVRRIGQVKSRYPHLDFLDIRGNLNTRLAKLDAPDSPYAALILAHAGLVRLDMSHRITEVLDTHHAVGQAAIAIQCRAGDDKVVDLMRRLTHADTHTVCMAERAFMRELEGGCSVPLGVKSSLKDGVLSLHGRVTSLDGCSIVDAHEQQDGFGGAGGLDIEKAEALGRRLAKDMAGRGAREIVAQARKANEIKIAQAQKGASIIQAGN
ncbi:MAG: hypothetical protein SGCHY_004942 [Lobulomycetales sp.]